MEQFKETIRRRLYALSTYAAGLVMLVLAGLTREPAAVSTEIKAFMYGVNAGLLAVVIILTVRSAILYIAALRHEDKLKDLYVFEHDERRLYKQSKMGGTAVQLLLMGLATAMVVSEFFNQTVFFTLLGAVLFVAAVKLALKIYYDIKIG